MGILEHRWIKHSPRKCHLLHHRATGGLSKQRDSVWGRSLSRLSQLNEGGGSEKSTMSSPLRPHFLQLKDAHFFKVHHQNSPVLQLVEPGQRYLVMASSSNDAIVGRSLTESLQAIADMDGGSFAYHVV
jgi:hypothetical protein